MRNLRLFDVMKRVDPRPASHLERGFEFLNRVDTVYWSRVRDLLEAWYADYGRSASAQKAADLRSRFRSKDPKQHEPAWWELYVFSLVRAHFPSAVVAVEEYEAAEGTIPDFCVIDGKRHPTMYIEAVAPFSGLGTGDHTSDGLAYVLDTINSIDSQVFGVVLGRVEHGHQRPRKSDIVEPIATWLAGLDHTAVVARYAAGDRRLPSHFLSVRGWRMELRAFPRRLDGRRRMGLIVAGPVNGGFVNDVTVLGTALRRKARGGRELECPYVIAARPSSPFFSTDSALDILYGGEKVRFERDDPEGTSHLVRGDDGLWSAATAHVSAVVLGAGIVPWAIGKTWPQLWPNPFATHSVADAFAIPHATVEGHEAVEWIGGYGNAPGELLGLDADWPGPEEPFPD